MSQKWNLQDIRPVQPKPFKKVVVNKAVPQKMISRPREIELNQQTVDEDIDENFSDEGTIVIKNSKKSRKFTGIYVALLLVFLFGGIFLSSKFLTKTELIVFPEFREPNVNANFVAYPDKRDNSLNYEVMTITETKEKQVKATGQEYAEVKAVGVIEIVKTTAGAERLIENTRFRSPDGLIFRLTKPVIVPGAVKDGGGTLIHGSIQAEVVADQSGDNYNLVSNTKFDVPAFKEKNLPNLYDAIYAINKSPITGGFKGEKYLINETELSTAKQSLQVELRDALIAKVENEKPAGFVAFPDAVSIVYNDLPTIEYGDQLVTIRTQGVLQIPIFKVDHFSSFIAKETIPTYSQGEEVLIRNMDTLKFTYTEASTTYTNIADLTSVSFNLTGKPLIVWEYDAEQLKKDLVGKQTTAVPTVLSGYTAIKDANLIKKPIWSRSFPDSVDKIIITESLEVKKNNK